MYARISRLNVRPASLEEAGEFEHESIELMCEDRGYRGFMLLADEAGETCVAITYWDSEEAMEVGERLASQRDMQRLVGHRSGVERLRLIREG